MKLWQQARYLPHDGFAIELVTFLLLATFLICGIMGHG